MTPSLRILVINWLDRENPSAGGAEKHFHEVFGRLAKKGHKVSALVSGWAGCEKQVKLDGINIHRSGSRYTFSLTAPKYYLRHLAVQQFDVVVEDLNKVPVFSPLWTTSPVVLLAHHLFGATAFQAASFPVALGTWLLERPIPFVFRRMPAIAVSQSTKDDLVRRGFSAGQIDIVPNGIDLDFFTPSADGSISKRPSLVYLGRLAKYKRVDLILEAVAELVSEGVDVELIICGDGEERSSLKAQIKQLGIAKHVRMLGFISEEDKLETLRRSWIHVLTSPKEGWGLSNIEAAACGTPSVVSDSPGLRESVRHGETGILVRHGDVSAVAQALRQLLKDKSLRSKMSIQAHNFAQRFSWDGCASGVESVLKRVVAKGSRE